MLASVSPARTTWTYTWSALGRCRGAAITGCGNKSSGSKNSSNAATGTRCARQVDLESEVSAGIIIFLL